MKDPPLCFFAYCLTFRVTWRVCKDASVMENCPYISRASDRVINHSRAIKWHQNECLLKIAFCNIVIGAARSKYLPSNFKGEWLSSFSFKFFTFKRPDKIPNLIEGWSFGVHLFFPYRYNVKITCRRAQFPPGSLLPVCPPVWCSGLVMRSAGQSDLPFWT